MYISSIEYLAPSVSFGETVEPLIFESRAKCLPRSVSLISVSRLEVRRAKRWCKGWFRKLQRGWLSRARLKRAVNAATAAETARTLSNSRAQLPTRDVMGMLPIYLDERIEDTGTDRWINKFYLSFRDIIAYSTWYMGRKKEWGGGGRGQGNK